MKRLIKYFFVALLAMAFYVAGFVMPWDLGPKGTVSIADAHHRPGHTCNGKKCGPPPTVSELPIQYMVFGGAALIAFSGGMVFLIRKRKTKSSPEA